MYFPVGMDMVDFQEEEAESATEGLFPRIDTGLCQSGDDVRASTPRVTLWWGREERARGLKALLRGLLALGELSLLGRHRAIFGPFTSLPD